MTAAVLWVLLLLFVLRVAGQLLVFAGAAPWLPPMSEWYSGLVPYGPLLAAQLVLIVLFVRIGWDLSTGRGYFAVPRLRLGQRLRTFGRVYLAAMVLRYVLRMALHPEARWTGGAIPIVFHWVLAAYVLVLAGYHRRESGALDGREETGARVAGRIVAPVLQLDHGEDRDST